MDVWQAWENHRGKGIIKLSPYPEPQHRHFERFAGRPVTVLEIGVYGGGSLEMWRDYFGADAQIIGVDIDPRCSEHEGERIEVHIGDQSDRAFLEHLAESRGPFDVIIDDGGHTMEQQITTFDVLFPRLRTGGVYVCEDAFSSYMARFGGGHGESHTFMERVAKPLVDHMHRWFTRDLEPTDETRTVGSVHFYLGMVVIEKAAVEMPKYMMKGEGGIVYKDVDVT